MSTNRASSTDQRRNNKSGEDRIGRYCVETKKVGIGGILSRLAERLGPYLDLRPRPLHWYLAYIFFFGLRNIHHSSLAAVADRFCFLLKCGSTERSAILLTVLAVGAVAHTVLTLSSHPSFPFSLCNLIQLPFTASERERANKCGAEA